MLCLLIFLSRCGIWLASAVGLYVNGSCVAVQAGIVSQIVTVPTDRDFDHFQELLYMYAYMTAHHQNITTFIYNS